MSDGEANSETSSASIADDGGFTLVDRKSRYTRIRRRSHLDVGHAAAVTVDELAGLVTKSVTNDNGVESQCDEELQDKMQIPICFFDRKSPWQRGSVENLSGLIRQYPKVFRGLKFSVASIA